MLNGITFYFQTKIKIQWGKTHYKILYNFLDNKRLKWPPRSGDLTDRLKGKEAWCPTYFTTRLFLHFPNEICYGYLTFEGNGKIPLGR